MVEKLPVRAADLRGVNQLTVAGVAGVVDLVEAMHHQIAVVPRLLVKPKRDRTTGITRLVYRSIHGVTGLVGRGIDLLFAHLAPVLGDHSTWPGREPLLAALNGVLGDHLAASVNPLAITMGLRRHGVALTLERAALAAAIPQASGKLLVLLHGLCMSDLQWTRDGHDHGEALARDLAYTPVYVHYNSGLHISTNGRTLAEQLEALVRVWPVQLTELVLVGYSMGGLVARSACHYGALAGHEWRRQLDKLIFIGTPHHGAPLERGGNWVNTLLGLSPYSAPLARLGKIRSAGITDLRYGNLLDDDWDGHDRFARGRDRRQAVPLPESVACFAIAATTTRKPARPAGRLLGDGLVPLASALGRHRNAQFALAFDKANQWVTYGTNHLDLLNRAEVYAQIKRWLAPRSLRCH